MNSKSKKHQESIAKGEALSEKGRKGRGRKDKA